MNADVFSTLALIFAIAAFIYAYRAYKRIMLTFHLLESRSTRTVSVDHTDGRITIIKELKDADPAPVPDRSKR